MYHFHVKMRSLSLHVFILVRVPFAGLKHDNQTNLGMSGFICLYFHVIVPQEGSHDRNSKRERTRKQELIQRT